MAVSVASAAAAAASATVSVHDLTMGVLLQMLDIPASKLTLSKKPEMVTPSAVLASGAKVNGPVSIAKFLVGLSGAQHTQWLGATDQDKAKVEEQMTFAGTLSTQLSNKDTWNTAMQDLNKDLTSKVFIVSNYFTLADIFLYSTLYLPVSKLNKQHRLGFCHITRYFDLIQHLCHETGKVNVTELVDVDLNAPPDEKPAAVEKKKEKGGDKAAAKAEGDAKGDAKGDKKKEKKGGDKAPAAAADGAKQPKEKKTEGAPAAGGSSDKKEKKKEEKKAAPAAAEPAGAESGAPEPGRLDMRVGHIITAKRHPQADTLYVEEIDLGEATPRTVVSGLVKWMPEKALIGRKIVVLCNLKPAKMRGIESQAMVLAATAADGSCVELLDAPEGAQPGDRCWFDSHPGTDFSQLNPKKKTWEIVQPHLKTDSSCRAVFAVENAGIRHLNVLRCSSGEIGTKTVAGGSIK